MERQELVSKFNQLKEQRDSIGQEYVDAKKVVQEMMDKIRTILEGKQLNLFDDNQNNQ